MPTYERIVDLAYSRYRVYRITEREQIPVCSYCLLTFGTSSPTSCAQCGGSIHAWTLRSKPKTRDSCSVYAKNYQFVCLDCAPQGEL